MYCIDSYKDLCTEIEIAKSRIEGLEEQKKILLKLMENNKPKDIAPIDYSGMPHGSKNFMSFDRIWDSLQHIENMLYIETEILQGMEKTKGKIEGKLSDLQGLQYKVAFMHKLGGKSLQDIAEELGYSYQYIKEVNAKNGVE